MFESSVLFLELNSTKPWLIYEHFNTSESIAAQKQIRKRCFDVHHVLMSGGVRTGIALRDGKNSISVHL